MSTRRRIYQSSLGSRIFDTANAIFMILFCISILFPIWDMIVQSFSLPEHITYLSVNLWPREWTLSAYRYVFSDATVLSAAGMTFARTVVGTLLHLAITCFAAYAMTMSDMPGRRFFIIYFLIPMFVGAGLIPSYLNMRALGLIDNFLVYVIPGSFSMYNAIVIRNYFYGIDSALRESAEIDGASQLTIFLRIMLPLSKPVLATVALWQIVGQWNAWFDNMIYTRGNPRLLTLQYLLRRMLDTLTTETQVEMSVSGVEAMGSTVDSNPDTIKAAMTIVVVLPIVFVYPFLQKYFVEGVMLGAVKG